MKKVTFIHAADIHLDSPFQGLTYLPDTIFEAVSKSTYTAFDTLIQTAINKQVDFILLVGDIFDQTNQSLKAQIHVRNAIELLNKHEITVYVSFGNHDFTFLKNLQVQLPANVFIFSSEQISSFIYEKEGMELVKISGFTYEHRGVMEEKVVEYPTHDPQIPFHIGMLHGSIHGDPIHDTYAPFQITQLQEKGYDYWALGHIHKRIVLQEQPPIIYPGNIQGRHAKETGEKGCYYVEMDGQTTETTFIPLQAIQFKEVHVNLSNLEKVNKVERHLYHTLNNLEKSSDPYFIQLTWEQLNPNQFGTHTTQLLEELIEIVNESLLEYLPWMYIYRTKFEMVKSTGAEINPLFLDEIDMVVNQMEVNDELSSLTNHKHARTLIQFENKEALLQSATERVIHLLANGNEE